MGEGSVLWKGAGVSVVDDDDDDDDEMRDNDVGGPVRRSGKGGSGGVPAICFAFNDLAIIWLVLSN